eukprot:COSAG06_NODE_3058_length_5911_cov_5.093083_5_plen_180_part_00
MQYGHALCTRRILYVCMYARKYSGGPINAAQGAGNNWPLRGGKHTAFEGGVRLSAFVAGGYLPINVRGTVNTGNIHLADWVRHLLSESAPAPAPAPASVPSVSAPAYNPEGPFVYRLFVTMLHCLCLCSRCVCVCACVSLSAPLHACMLVNHIDISMPRFAPWFPSTLTTIVPLRHLRL